MFCAIKAATCDRRLFPVDTAGVCWMFVGEFSSVVGVGGDALNSRSAWMEPTNHQGARTGEVELEVLYVYLGDRRSMLVRGCVVGGSEVRT